MIYNLILDEKVSVWRRSIVTIEARSLKEAVKDLLDNGTAHCLDIPDSEYLHETEEYLEGDGVVEVMDLHYKTLAEK